MPNLSQVKILAAATLYMVFLGTPYMIGAISPYLAAYFHVETSKV